VTASLRAWLVNVDLPDPARLLDGEEQFTPDRDRIDRTMAVYSSCAALVAPKTAEKRNERAAALWQMLAGNLGMLDVVYPAVRALCNRDTLLVRLGGKLNTDAEAVLKKLGPAFAAAGIMERV